MKKYYLILLLLLATTGVFGQVGGTLAQQLFSNTFLGRPAIFSALNDSLQNHYSKISPGMDVSFLENDIDRKKIMILSIFDTIQFVSQIDSDTLRYHNQVLLSANKINSNGRIPLTEIRDRFKNIFKTSLVKLQSKIGKDSTLLMILKYVLGFEEQYSINVPEIIISHHVLATADSTLFEKILKNIDTLSRARLRVALAQVIVNGLENNSMTNTSSETVRNALDSASQQTIVAPSDRKQFDTLLTHIYNNALNITLYGQIDTLAEYLTERILSIMRQGLFDAFDNQFTFNQDTIEFTNDSENFNSTIGTGLFAIKSILNGNIIQLHDQVKDAIENYEFAALDYVHNISRFLCSANMGIGISTLQGGAFGGGLLLSYRCSNSIGISGYINNQIIGAGSNNQQVIENQSMAGLQGRFLTRSSTEFIVMFSKLFGDQYHNAWEFGFGGVQPFYREWLFGVSEYLLFGADDHANGVMIGASFYRASNGSFSFFFGMEADENNSRVHPLFQMSLPILPKY